MAERVRLSLYFPTPVANTLDTLSADLGMSRQAVIRRALGVLITMEDARKQGAYVGVTHNRKALDTVIVAPI